MNTTTERIGAAVQHIAPQLPTGLHDDLVFGKLADEMTELFQALDNGDSLAVLAELADVAYYVGKAVNMGEMPVTEATDIIANASVVCGVTPEIALRVLNAKYKSRIRHGKDHDRERDAIAAAYGLTSEWRVQPVGSVVEVRRIAKNLNNVADEIEDPDTFFASGGDKELLYYKAIAQNKKPKFLPKRIMIHRRVQSDGANGQTTYQEPGAHPCESNTWGAVSVMATNGKLLGLRLNEFDVLEWRFNGDAFGVEPGKSSV